MAGPGRIGVLGGTFDPIHVGHLAAAVNVRHALSLDLVLLVVANVPWQKVSSRSVTPAADRLALVEAAVGDLEGVAASAAEIERGGPSYTADTLAELGQQYPGAELHLIVGADVAGELETWVRVDEVRAGVTLVVVGRPGAGSPEARLSAEGWRVTRVAIPALEVSSTDLRARVADGRPLDLLIPAAAIREIRRRGMYASSR